MRSIIIMALAVGVGASAANTTNYCLKAKVFLEKNKAPIEALLDKKASDNHLNITQEMAKIKLTLLEKAVDLNIPFICKKLKKKVKKLVGMVALLRAVTPASEDAVPSEAPTTTESETTTEPAKTGTSTATPATTESVPTIPAASDQPTGDVSATPTAETSRALVIEQAAEPPTEESKAPKTDNDKPSDKPDDEAPREEHPASQPEPAK